MTLLACPACGTQLTVTPVDPTARPPRKDSPVTSAVLRAVFDFMRDGGPRSEFSSQLYEDYQATGGPEISKNAFARALRMNGASSWRKADGRGFSIPALGEDDQPAKEAPTVRKQGERASYLQALVDHSTTTYVWRDGSHRKTPEPEPTADEYYEQVLAAHQGEDGTL